jgi:hypothetical protein
LTSSAVKKSRASWYAIVHMKYKNIRPYWQDNPFQLIQLILSKRMKAIVAGDIQLTSDFFFSIKFWWEFITSFISKNLILFFVVLDSFFYDVP